MALKLSWTRIMRHHMIVSSAVTWMDLIHVTLPAVTDAPLNHFIENKILAIFSPQELVVGTLIPTCTFSSIMSPSWCWICDMVICVFLHVSSYLVETVKTCNLNHPLVMANCCYLYCQIAIVPWKPVDASIWQTIHGELISYIMMPSFFWSKEKCPLKGKEKRLCPNSDLCKGGASETEDTWIVMRLPP